MNSACTSKNSQCVEIFSSRYEKIQSLLHENDYEDASDEEPDYIDDSDKDPDFVCEEENQTDCESDLEDENDLLERRQLISTEMESAIEDTPSDENGGEEFYYGKDGYSKWNKKEPPRNRRTPAHNILRGGLPGLTVKSRMLGQHPSTVQVWKMLFDNSMIDLMVTHTNAKLNSVRESVQNKSSYRDTDVVEMNAFIGLLLLSSIFKSNHEDLLSLFSKDPTGRPIFHATMSAKRFEILLRCLRFDDSTTREERKNNDKACAISEIFNKFIANSQEAYTVSDNVTIDEMLIPFRGKCFFRVYIPSKPAKYGIKVMCLADSKTSYLYNAYIYTGKGSDGIGMSEEEKKFKVPSQSVLRLCKPIEKSNRNITADNYFSSVEIVDELKRRGLTFVGTVRKNKREIPPEFNADKSRPVGSTLYGFSDQKTLLSFVPKKNKAVILISSMHHKIDTNLIDDKPEIISYYNSTKSGVDVLDLKCANYSSNRRTRRWPLAVFYTTINVASVNSFILYTCFSDNPILSRFKFVKQLAKELIEPHLHRRLAIPNIRRDVKYLIEKILDKEPENQEQQAGPPSDRLEKRKTCSICPSKKDRKTAYKCIKCAQPICLECSRKVCLNCSTKFVHI